MIFALLDAILRPLLLIILVACVVVAVSIAHDAFTTAYSEPED